MEGSQLEKEEHNFLESLMKDLGIEEKWEDRGMEVDFDQEMDYLEDVLMNLADDVGIGVGDMFDTGEINDKDMVGGMMNGCLENIRMVMGESMDQNDLVVNEGAYHSEGSWFLNNWFHTKRMGSVRGYGEDRSSEWGDLSMDVVSKCPSLLMFSIVGTAGSTRKRSNGRRKGRWWSASGWVPGPRTCTPWKVGRRIHAISVISDEQLTLEEMQETMQVVCLDRSIKDKMVASRIEQNNLLFAGNIATSDKSQPKVNIYWAKDNNVSVAGIVPEIGSKYQKLEQKQEECLGRGMEDKILSELKSAGNKTSLDKSQFKENSYWAQETNSTSGDGGDIDYVDGKPDEGLPQDVEDVQQDEEDQVAMHGGWDDSQHHAGEVQEGDSHGAQHQQLHYTMQQASIGDGFTSRFRKITRATRKYRGIPDGRVQIKLFDLGFCGGGMSLTGEMGKKRKVEREPDLRNTRCRLSGT